MMKIRKKITKGGIGMKRIFLILIVVFASVSIFAQNGSYLKTSKNTANFEISVLGAYALDFGDMNNFLSSESSIYKSDFKDINMWQVGFGWLGNYFFADNFAYQYGLKYLRGNDASAKDDFHASSNDFIGFMGVEYYFYKRNNIALSANVAVSCDMEDFNYGIYGAQWVNLTLPFGVTFWFRNLGFQLNYHPTLIKSKPENTNLDLPKTALNNLAFSFRISL